MKIPQKHVAALVELAKLSDQSFTNLLACIKQVAPHIKIARVMDGVTVAIKRSLPESSPALMGDLAEALSAVVTTMAKAEFDPRLSKQICEAVAEQGALQPGEASVFEGRIQEVLRLPTLRLSAKGSILQVEHDRVFTGGKVTTDVRPIFGESFDSDFAFMVIHQLQISFLRNEERQEAFFALDDEDLLSLKKAIDRAVEKSNMLRRTMNKVQFKLIDGGTDDL